MHVSQEKYVSLGTIVLRRVELVCCPDNRQNRKANGMKRRILLVDDEVAVLLTLKAVLEISGFEVDTAASAREGKLKLRANEYQMVISDMRMESDEAGAEIVQAARAAASRPAIALLTAYPLAEEDWQELGADQMLVKPMHTRLLLEQIESLLAAHESKLSNGAEGNKGAAASDMSGKKRTKTARKPVRKTAKKTSARAVASSALTRKTRKKPSKRIASKTASNTEKKRRQRG